MSSLNPAQNADRINIGGMVDRMDGFRNAFASAPTRTPAAVAPRQICT